MSDAGPGGPAATICLHACAATWCGRGVLVQGAPGAGKSSLVAQMLAAGAYLIADDLVRLTRRADRVVASATTATGLIELRGNGIFQVATADGVPVSLCVELISPAAGERLPETGVAVLLGAEIQLLRLCGHAPGAVAQILLSLVACRVH